MRIAVDVVGWVLIVVAGVTAVQQLTKLSTVRQAISDPAGATFRISVLLAGSGVLLLLSGWGNTAGHWTVIGVIAAILVWVSSLFILHQTFRKDA